MGFRTINSLMMNREYMTMEEVYTHIDWLNTFSEHDKGRRELIQYLPNMLHVFKKILLQYDNNEINICVTSIFNNLFSKSYNTDKTPARPAVLGSLVANICTEPIPMKPQFIQVPSAKRKRSPSKKAKAQSRHPTYIVTNSRKRI